MLITIYAVWIALVGGGIDPAPDLEWSEGSTSGAPTTREACSVVWTGRELIVWGGCVEQGAVERGAVDGDYLASGARYDPVADRWRRTSTRGAPRARAWHTAVWTGKRMLIWGGDELDDELSCGASYDPGADSWRPLTNKGAPAARGSHVAVWTGTEMIVWAGVTESNSFSSGGRYDPATDRWAPIQCETGEMLPRSTTAVWTGKEMLVWGGINGSWVLRHGFRYNPVKDEWRAMSTRGAPSARAGHAGVWTGTEFIVWGGRDQYSIGTPLADGGRYSPATDRWSPLPLDGSRIGRDRPAWAWTGRELVVLGGRTEKPSEAKQLEGACLDPATGVWRAVPAPDGAELSSGAWTGSGLVVCGGSATEPRMRVWRCTWPGKSVPQPTPEADRPPRKDERRER